MPRLLPTRSNRPPSEQALDDSRRRRAFVRSRRPHWPLSARARSGSANPWRHANARFVGDPRTGAASRSWSSTPSSSPRDAARTALTSTSSSGRSEPSVSGGEATRSRKSRRPSPAGHQGTRGAESLGDVVFTWLNDARRSRTKRSRASRRPRHDARWSPSPCLWLGRASRC